VAHPAGEEDVEAGDPVGLVIGVGEDRLDLDGEGGVTTSSASRRRIQSQRHFWMATFFCSEWPRKSRLKEWLAPKARAISGVLSEEPESTMTISSTQRRPSRVRGRFFSSLRAIMATEMVGLCGVSSAIFIFSR